MKKLYFSLLSLFSVISLVNAQSSLLVTNISNGNSVITNGMTIYRGVASNGLDQMDVNIKNTTGATHTYKMRMYYDSRNIVAPGDSANPYFCFAGLCYSPDVYTSPRTQTLTANQDASSIGSAINIHYDEASVAGNSTIRYRIFETTNASSDVMEFTIQYNSPLSVNNYSPLISNVSDVYPNPSTGKAFVTVNALSGNTTNVSVTNSLGSIVYSKNIELSLGKNVIPLDVEELSSGIYFTTILTGNSKIVKKFTVNK